MEYETLWLHAIVCTKTGNVWKNGRGKSMFEARGPLTNSFNQTMVTPIGDCKRYKRVMYKCTWEGEI